MSAHRWLISSAVLCVVIPVALDARAGLFRCQRPDGSVVYTDSQATCPGAKPHEPQATVQSVDKAASSRRLAPAPRAFAPAAGESAEAQWRNKKQQAEQEFEQLTLRASEIEPFITTCNRGGYLWMKQDNGLKKRISCSGVREHFAELESRPTILHHSAPAEQAHHLH